MSNSVDQHMTEIYYFVELWRKFVDRVFSRSWGGLWNALQLKMLYYNLVHAGLVSV